MSDRFSVRDQATLAAQKVAENARSKGHTQDFAVACAVAAAEPLIYCEGVKQGKYEAGEIAEADLNHKYDLGRSHERNDAMGLMLAALRLHQLGENSPGLPSGGIRTWAEWEAKFASYCHPDDDVPLCDGCSATLRAYGFRVVHEDDCPRVREYLESGDD